MSQQRLDPSKTRSDITETIKELSQRILFQPRAIQSIKMAVTHSHSPFRRQNRPIHCVLFIGPSGVGKTALVRELSDIMFQDPHGVVTIDGSEFGSEFTASRILGSPPGYVGYEEPTPLRQERVDRPALARVRKILAHIDPGRHKEIEELDEKISEMRQELRLLKQGPNASTIKDDIKKIRGLIQQLQNKQGLILQMTIREHGGFFSLVLFDEIEKAHPKIWNLLLQILDEGRLNLSDGNTTSFNNSIIVLTSNVESRKMAQFASGVPEIGFSDEHKIGDKAYEQARQLVSKTFPPELLGRVDNIVLFRPFGERELRTIVQQKIDLLLKEIAYSRCPFELEVDEQIYDFIVKEALERPEEGARRVKKKVFSHLGEPIETLIVSGQIQPAETIRASIENDVIIFTKDTEQKGVQDKETFNKISQQI